MVGAVGHPICHADQVRHPPEELRFAHPPGSKVNRRARSGFRLSDELVDQIVEWLFINLFLSDALVHGAVFDLEDRSRGQRHHVPTRL